MKLVMLLSWWDEPVANLQRAITDSIAAGCTHVVALDGAYPATPTDTPLSQQEQYEAIIDACRAHGVPLVLQQSIGFAEPEKRTLLFQLMYEQFDVTPDDWCFVMDADQTIDEPKDVKPWLERIKGDVVDTLIYEHDDTRFEDATRRRFVRQMFRCIPGLHVDQSNHWTYKDAAGRVMWGMNSVKTSGLAPLVMHNWSRNRTEQRAAARDGYYQARTDQQLEDWIPEQCYECSAPWAYQMAVGFTITALPDGGRELTSERTLYLCETHAQKHMRKNAARAAYLANGDREAQQRIAEVIAGTVTRNPLMHLTLPC